MDVSEMLARENLPVILRDTIEHFYRDLQHKDVLVSLEKEHMAEPLYLLSRPGIVSKRWICKQAYETIMSEYSLRGNLLKFFAARAYILVRLWLMDRFATAKLYITGEDSNSLDHMLIVPNNKSIRIFDYDTDSVYSVVKSGLSADFINHQIGFRKEHDYPFILPIVASGDGWFQEQVLHGHALVRVRDQEGYKESLDQAVLNIRKLFSDSYQEIEKQQYYKQLVREIEQLLQEAGVNIDEANKIWLLAKGLYPKNESPTGMMKIGLSHGDFQPGNIWRDNNGKTWIYDWETVCMRSAWYDMAIMFSGLRSGKTYYTFLTNSLEWTTGDEEEDDIKRVVVIEDLIFQLKEAMVFHSEYRERFIKRIWQQKCSECEELIKNE